MSRIYHLGIPLFSPHNADIEIISSPTKNHRRCNLRSRELLRTAQRAVASVGAGTSTCASRARTRRLSLPTPDQPSTSQDAPDSERHRYACANQWGRRGMMIPLAIVVLALGVLCKSRDGSNAEPQCEYQSFHATLGLTKMTDPASDQYAAPAPYRRKVFF